MCVAAVVVIVAGGVELMDVSVCFEPLVIDASSVDVELEVLVTPLTVVLATELVSTLTDSEEV